MKQLKAFTIEQYADTNCMQLEDILMGMALHSITGGFMCIDCPKQSCEDFNILRKAAIKNANCCSVPETVREEAKRTGLGIKAVRRLRRDNELKRL